MKATLGGDYQHQSQLTIGLKVLAAQSMITTTKINKATRKYRDPATGKHISKNAIILNIAGETHKLP